MSGQKKAATSPQRHLQRQFAANLAAGDGIGTAVVRAMQQLRIPLPLQHRAFARRAGLLPKPRLEALLPPCGTDERVAY